MATSIVFRTIRQQIVEQLRKEVMAGEIAEGESLREQKLADRFGVSRGPIRDALLQLTQEGLLVAEANRGVRVSRAPSLLIQPLVVDLRRRIETFALGAIFDQLAPADDTALATILRQFEVACQGDSLSTVIDHDIGLHRWIVERVGDVDLLQMWLATIVRMRLRYTRHNNLLESYAEHQAIVEAITRRDRVAAHAALEANIQ